MDTHTRTHKKKEIEIHSISGKNNIKITKTKLLLEKSKRNFRAFTNWWLNLSNQNYHTNRLVIISFNISIIGVFCSHSISKARFAMIVCMCVGLKQKQTKSKSVELSIRYACTDSKIYPLCIAPDQMYFEHLFFFPFAVEPFVCWTVRVLYFDSGYSHSL